MTRHISALTMQRVIQQFSSSLGALSLSALAFVAADTHAAVPTQSHSIALRYAHTAISSPEEAAKLYRSIKSAARQVCGVNAGRTSLSEYQHAQRCYQQTLDDVVSEVNLPQLTEVHQSAASKVG